MSPRIRKGRGEGEKGGKNEPLQPSNVNQHPPPTLPLLHLQHQLDFLHVPLTLLMLALPHVPINQVAPLLPHPRTRDDVLRERLEVRRDLRATGEVGGFGRRGVGEFGEVEGVVEDVLERLEARFSRVEEGGDAGEFARGTELRVGREKEVSAGKGRKESETNLANQLELRVDAVAGCSKLMGDLRDLQDREREGE